MLGFLPFHIKNYLECAIYVAISVVLLIINPWLGFIAMHLAALALWSLRTRNPINLTEFISPVYEFISPIDGKIVEINRSWVRDGIECVKIVIETGFLDSHTQYAPISGEILKQEIQLLEPNTKLPFTVPWAMNGNNRLVTEILDKRNNNRCIVQTDVYSLVPWSIIDKIDYNTSFIEQGQLIGVWHCTPVISFTTTVYLDLGSDVNVEVGHTSIGGHTTLASRSKIELMS